MPYKTGTLKGELTAPELRRLIKKHNELMSIKIPPKTDRAGLLALIKKNGYQVDHEKQMIIPKVQMKRKPKVKLPPPKVKSPEELKLAKQKRETKKKEKMEKEGELIKKGAVIGRLVSKKMKGKKK